MIFYCKKILLFLFVLSCHFSYGVDDNYIYEIQEKGAIEGYEAEYIIKQQVGIKYPKNFESSPFVRVKIERDEDGNRSIEKIYNKDSNKLFDDCDGDKRKALVDAMKKEPELLQGKLNIMTDSIMTDSEMSTTDPLYLGPGLYSKKETRESCGYVLPKDKLLIGDDKKHHFLMTDLCGRGIGVALWNEDNKQVAIRHISCRKDHDLDLDLYAFINELIDNDDLNSKKTKAYIVCGQNSINLEDSKDMFLKRTIDKMHKYLNIDVVGVSCPRDSLEIKTKNGNWIKTESSTSSEEVDAVKKNGEWIKIQSSKNPDMSVVSLMMSFFGECVKENSFIKHCKRFAKTNTQY